VELALNLLCNTVEERLARREHLEGESALVSEGLLQTVADPNQASPPFLAHYLKLDHSIVRYLLGQSGLHAHLARCCELIDPKVDQDGLSFGKELQSALLALLQQRGRHEATALYFQGRPGTEKRKAAEVLAGSVGCQLLVVDLERVADEPEFDSRLQAILREGRLRGYLLYFSGLDGLRSDSRAKERESLLRRLSQYGGNVILAGAQPWIPGASVVALTIPFGALEFDARRAHWQAELGALGLPLADADLDSLAGRFQLTASQIEEAVEGASNASRWRAARSGQVVGTLLPTLDELYAGARSETSHQLAKLAHKIEPRHSWEDVVLPSDQLAHLQEICRQAEYRHLVFGAWGFDRKLSLGKGLNVLFFGPPGTGKTMSAEVIAHELKLDVYRIELSQIISKYIGETEKNLDQIFSAAENSNAILFFDEADALFGKRSEVRDSHDRYANIEISYLLQKMEEYQGVSILATNRRQNLDEAFVRRLQAIVEFPFPDEEYRRRIWLRAFPKEAPLGEDVEFDRLAREVRLAGGNIKNMAVAAAFYAAADGRTIHMAHLVQAARREHQKLGRAWNEAVFRQTGISAMA
jgi:DNA polymerase III delta prime subunit